MVTIHNSKRARLYKWHNDLSFSGVRYIKAEPGSEPEIQEYLYYSRIDTGLTPEEAEVLVEADYLD
jgi:hypothetical protein